eukprot:Gb_15722 [translate_table: standard]
MFEPKVTRQNVDFGPHSLPHSSFQSLHYPLIWD